MKLALVTPTHNPQWLLDTYRSIKDSKHPFVWLIARCGIAEDSIPAEIRSDPRVLSHPIPPSNVIGDLKRRAFMLAAAQTDADILVELDHDDWFSPGGLDKLTEFCSEQSTPGFYYSDFISLEPDGASRVYSARDGWVSYPATFNGTEYRAMRSFGWHPSSFTAIQFVPNHVRAWHRDVYEKLGGHDKSLAVCDDYDLLCRTYLAGVPAYHCQLPLYFYREHPGNTYRKEIEQIAKLQQEICNRYFFSIVTSWCRRESLRMINLADTAIDGFEHPENVEYSSGLFIPGVEANTVGCLRLIDRLQRIPAERVANAMTYIHGLLAPGGWCMSITPSTDGRAAFQDLASKSFWNSNSFWLFTDKFFADRSAYFVRAQFQGTRVWNGYPSAWHELHKMSYVYADLLAIKGQEVAGEVKI